MASKNDATTPTTSSGMRRCIGSTTFGIEAHEAPVDDFPVQASAKDGLGRMCRPHWTEYTRALRKASLARKAAAAPEPRGPWARRGLTDGTWHHTPHLQFGGCGCSTPTP